MRHVGIRPVGPLVMKDFKRKLYIEEVSEGEYRVWTKRQLKSGCGRVTRNLKEMRGCYYCPYCDEWFNKDQWES